MTSKKNPIVKTEGLMTSHGGDQEPMAPHDPAGATMDALATETPTASASMLPGQQSLAELETIIAGGFHAFIEVGMALSQIQKDDLYKVKGYRTFDDYVKRRWGMSRQYAYQTLNAAKVQQTLSAIADIQVRPTHESQVRPLTKLNEDQQCEVWKAVVMTAGNKPITAKLVQDTVKKIEDKKKEAKDQSERDKREADSQQIPPVEEWQKDDPARVLTGMDDLPMGMILLHADDLDCAHDWMKAAKKLLLPNCVVFARTSWEREPEMRKFIGDNGFVVKGRIIRVTNRTSPDTSDGPEGDEESILWATQGKVAMKGKDGYRIPRVYRSGPENTDDRPEEMPVRFLMDLIEVGTVKGELVVALSGGIGNVVLAAHQKGRKVLAFQPEHKLYQEGLERIDAHLHKGERQNQKMRATIAEQSNATPIPTVIQEPIQQLPAPMQISTEADSSDSDEVSWVAPSTQQPQPMTEGVTHV